MHALEKPTWVRAAATSVRRGLRVSAHQCAEGLGFQPILSALQQVKTQSATLVTCVMALQSAGQLHCKHQTLSRFDAAACSCLCNCATTLLPATITSLTAKAASTNIGNQWPPGLNPRSEDLNPLQYQQHLTQHLPAGCLLSWLPGKLVKYCYITTTAEMLATQILLNATHQQCRPDLS
jgi:hypothetical protein